MLRDDCRKAFSWLVPLIFLLSLGAECLATTEYVTTTDRLNLRTCPSTQGCEVIQTLNVATTLVVLDRKGEWLSVEVADNGSLGWVHSNYTTGTAAPRRTTFFQDISNYLESIRVWLLISGGLLVPAWTLKKVAPGINMGRFLFLIVGAFVIGAFFLLNQFGPVLAVLLQPYLDLSPLQGCWQLSEQVAPMFSYSQILGIVTTASLLTAILIPNDSGARRFFLQGWLAGVLLLPALALAVVVGWLVVNLLNWLFVWVLLPVIRLIAIPFFWLWDHLFGPLVKWIWNALLLPALRWIATPFLWIWNNVLKEIALIIADWFKLLVHPLMWVLFTITLASVALLPIMVVGVSILDALRTSATKPFNSSNLFAHGFSLGLLVTDIVILMVLSQNALISGPPLSLHLLLIIPILAVLRLLMDRSELRKPQVASEATFRELGLAYFRTSPANLIASCFVLPFLLMQSVLARLTGGGD